MPRIEVAGDICLWRPSPTQGCKPDDDYDLINGMNFGKNYLRQNLCFLFPLETFYSKMNSESYCHKGTEVITERTPNTCRNLMINVCSAEF